MNAKSNVVAPAAWARGAMRQTVRRVPFERAARLIDMRPGRVGELIVIRSEPGPRPFAGRPRPARLVPAR